ncbi:MAG: N-acetylglucosamine-6-phosphate deacetylase [Bacteroidales bacterium]
MQNTTHVSGIHYESGEYVKVKISEGLIKSITPEVKANRDAEDVYISPGLIDNQTNGYAGINFQDEIFSVERMRKAAKAIWKDGVTTFIPTIVTESRENLLRNFRILAEVFKDDFLLGSVPGSHLEGPYISPVHGFYGCHLVSQIRKPSWDEFMEFHEAAGGKIILVTIAPELEGAFEFIKKCFSHGIIVSIGHTNATAEQINHAVDCGASLSTHLGNGCANMINRHRNPLWPQLANDKITPSVIADGLHLLPEELTVFYKVKGEKNIFITSDVTHLAGMPAGEYSYMGSRVVMNEEGLILNPALNVLAGASAPLKKGIQTMMNFTGCRLNQAVNLACKNVAIAHRLNDRGTLETGKRADIILFTMGKNNEVIIKETLVAGKKVFPE